MKTIMITKDNGFIVSVKEFEKIKQIVEIQLFIADNNIYYIKGY